MKQSTKCALGGIISALSLVLLISVAIVPFLTYALPAAAGALIVLAVIEMDKKWALGIYSVVAILGALLVPEKEVAAMYIAFFGYYPVLKAVLESKCNTVVSWILKLVSFLATMTVSYALMMSLMGLEIDEIEEFGMIAVPMLLGMGAFAFVMYDIALSKFILVYLEKWRKHYKRYFK